MVGFSFGVTGRSHAEKCLVIAGVGWLRIAWRSQAGRIAEADAALLGLQDYVHAVQYGNQVFKLFPGNAPAAVHLNNAVASYQAMQNSQCVEFGQMAIRQDPNVLKQAWGINEAIYALHELGRRQEALVLAKRRKEADPNWAKDQVLVKMLKVMGVVQ